MRKGSALLGIVVALVAVACDSRPQAPEFVETTTTSSTIAGSGGATTTTPTLPPVEERVTGTVTEITDGDTIRVTVLGESIDVRLLGINAPETTECWGDEATAVLASMVLGQEVQMVAGAEDLDSFGRALRFVYIETAEVVSFVNLDLTTGGHAVAVQNGNEFAPSLKAAEARAFQSGRGMWGTFACGDAEGIKADRPVIRVSELAFNPDGPDDASLESEFVTIVNEGYGRVSIQGWVLRDESSSNRLTFPNGTVLAPGESVTVVTGCDGAAPDAIYWCSDTPVWSNGGDTAIVSDTLGNAVVWFTYSGGQS
ncbi:MAG: lamin tail domain-containing protein [Acidimicrobiia bacterium]